MGCTGSKNTKAAAADVQPVGKTLLEGQPAAAEKPAASVVADAQPEVVAAPETIETGAQDTDAAAAEQAAASELSTKEAQPAAASEEVAAEPAAASEEATKEAEPAESAAVEQIAEEVKVTTEEDAGQQVVAVAPKAFMFPFMACCTPQQASTDELIPEAPATE